MANHSGISLIHGFVLGNKKKTLGYFWIGRVPFIIYLRIMMCNKNIFLKAPRPWVLLLKLTVNYYDILSVLDS